MKRYLPVILVLFISLFSSNAFSQSSWVAQNNPLGSGETAMLGKIQFVSATEGWISCANGGLLHTTNAGDVWNFINPFPADTVVRGSDPAVSMSWVGTTHGWIIGTIGSFSDASGAILYYTTNSGAIWQKKILSTVQGDFGFQIQFVDVNNGWLLIFNFASQVASFLRTMDGGNNWVPFNGAGIFYFVDANNGWSYFGSGQNGADPPYKILRTTNGGTDWTEQFSDNTVGELNSMKFSDLNNGWIVGSNGKVLKTNDGGINWSYVNNSGINPMTSCKTVFLFDPNNIWISSKTSDPQQTPYVQYTSDGGATWGTQMTPFGSVQGSNAIFSICFIDAQNGWLTADYGRIARFTGTTGIEENNNIPNEFSLSQNYPNPFNPSTTIRFTLLEEGNVKLNVYNILGQDVKALISENKEAGVYIINFNADGLDSGVYFYKLQINGVVQTRKMTLLK